MFRSGGEDAAASVVTLTDVVDDDVMVIAFVIYGVIIVAITVLEENI